MKKDIPGVIKIEVPIDPEITEDLLLSHYNDIISNNYVFAFHDFYIYAAILLRRYPLNDISDSIKELILQDGEIKPEIRSNMVLLSLEKKEKLSPEDEEFYWQQKFIIAKERKRIVRKEIERTGFKKEAINSSIYFRELIKIIKNFTDFTLIDGFIPIILTFEKFVHIYIKHVEETKFGEGQFKRRTFFTYKHNDILLLLRKLLEQEEEDIRGHFLNNSIGFKLNDMTMVKAYHRGFKNFPPIRLEKDEFRLSISKLGFIESFYQVIKPQEEGL